MNTAYFIIVDNASQGPFSKEDLRARGITRDTLIWKEGMADWSQASSLPELADLFMEAQYGGAPHHPGQPQQGWQQPGAQQGIWQQGQGQFQGQQSGQQGWQPGPGAPYGQGQYPPPHQNPYSVDHTNWLPWAIVGTVLGFLFSCVGGVLGIIAITKANAANDNYKIGNIEAGERENSSAKTLTIISLVLAGLGLVGTGYYFNSVVPLLSTF